MTFRAQYGGTCESCWERIKPGQLVRYTSDGQLVHADCADETVDHPVKRPTVEVCQSCWMQRPCPCDDGQGAA
jgi:hypothetical protein